jgi:hypothetical protein
MEGTTTDTRTSVYLAGDPVPIVSALSAEEVVLKLVEAFELAAGRDALVFVRLPLEGDRGDALVRPSAIVAIVPGAADDD